MLASSSYDATITLVDFKTGKVIHSEQTSDKSNSLQISLIINLFN